VVAGKREESCGQLALCMVQLCGDAMRCSSEVAVVV